MQTEHIALQLLLMFPYLKIEPLCGTLEWSFKKVKVANSSHDFLDALIKASSIKMHQELLLQLTTYFTKNSISQRSIIMQKRRQNHHHVAALHTDWIFFFRPFSLCVNEAPASFEAFFISYFVCRIWSMHHESSPKCSITTRSNPNHLITAIHQLG